MSEIAKYEAYAKKLEGICEENNLVATFKRDSYPITLTIRPLTGLYEQMSMLENVEENGYTSPEASIVFTIKDGVLGYKTSETFSISDALFSKIKNLFKNLHYYWLQFFFRDLMERKVLNEETMPKIGEEDAIPEEAEPLESYDDDLEEEEGQEEDDEAYPGPSLGLDNPDIREAIRIVRAENIASVSLLQRQMYIDYAKAVRYIEALEQLGVIGPPDGSRSREVLPYDEPEDPDGDKEE